MPTVYSGIGSIPNNGRVGDIKNLTNKLRSLLSTPESTQRNYDGVNPLKSDKTVKEKTERANLANISQTNRDGVTTSNGKYGALPSIDAGSFSKTPQ